MNDIVKFKGANLPSQGLGNYQQALLRAKDQVGIVSNTPFLKLEKNTGDWVYGAEKVYVEDNSLWAINPTSFEVGFVAWRGGRPVGQKMRSIGDKQPVTMDELPDVGAEWSVCIGFKLMCIHGEDAGGPGKEPVTVEYTANTRGGKKAFNEMLSAMYRQSEEDPSKPVPIVELLNTFYMHPEYGKTYEPDFKIRRWMAMQGEPTAQPEAQPDNKKPDAEPVAATNGAGAAPRRRAAAVVTDVETETAEAAKPAQGPAEPVQRRRRRAAAS